MHGVAWAPLFQLLECPAEVVESLAVDVLDLTLGRHDGDEAGDGIDDQPKTLFARGEAILDVRPLLVISSGPVAWFSRLTPLCRPCPIVQELDLLDGQLLAPLAKLGVDLLHLGDDGRVAFLRVPHSRHERPGGREKYGSDRRPWA